MKEKTKMCKKVDAKGITLIALIITIIVMLILVAVTISVALNGGLISKAQEAKNGTIEAQEKEEITFALAEWKIVKDKQDAPTFEEFLKGIFGNDNVTAGGENECNVTFPETGNQYKVKGDGSISDKGIFLSQTKLVLQMKEEEPVIQKDLTAKLKNITGEVKWSISQSMSFVELSSTTGETITVKALIPGTAVITVTCGDYTEKCNVIVKPEIGAFVEYDLPYEDIYSGYNFTSSDGWRYIGKDEEGRSLIVSTGVPAKLRYVPTSTSNRYWVGSNTETKEAFNKNTVNDAECAEYGLYYNFEKIKLYGESQIEEKDLINEGIYRKIGYSDTTTSEKTMKDFVTVEGATVHCLTSTEVKNICDVIDERGGSRSKCWWRHRCASIK